MGAVVFELPPVSKRSKRNWPDETGGAADIIIEGKK
jgi:hypothetical protein